MVLTEHNSLHSESPLKKKKDEEESIQVFVRVRPINSQEKNKHGYSILDCPGTREVVVKERSNSNVTKTFTFDRAFGPQSKQIDVYKAVVSPLLEKVIQGYNCTVFAYGQTGTGKTFTMEGERSELSVNWSQDPKAGIVPRALGQLFDELRQQESEFTIRVSFLELYNEELYDLLAPVDGSKLKNLRMFEDPNKKNSVTINGLEEVIVQSKHEVYQIMEKGSERRKTAATLMNATSSRSHTVLTVTVHIKESTMEGEDLLKIGKLNLVDLAGSENIGRSGAVDKRAREAGNINQSLLTLGRVITALVEHAPHIPYRESKLTRILKDSLGGTTKTSIIATVSPANINVEETLSTLEYAHRAKNIYNQPVVNQRLTKHLVMSHYTDEIERLRRDLAASREKNGFYVDKANYDEMQARIVALSQELQQNATHIKNQTENLEKFQADINMKDAQIEDLQEEMQMLKCVFEETRTKLLKTEKALLETAQAKAEQEHLVEKHVLTEKKLANEASTLMVTADEVTNNIERLYSKLERKRHVEQTNLEAGKRLKREIADQLNDISENIDQFRKEHATFCGEQRLKLDEFVSQQQQGVLEFQESSKEIQAELKTICLQSEELVQQQNENILTLRSANDEDLVARCQQNLEVFNQVMNQLVNISLPETNEKLRKMHSVFAVVVNTFTDYMNKEAGEVEKYVNLNVAQLKGFKKDLKKLHDIHVSCNSDVTNVLKGCTTRNVALQDVIQEQLNQAMANISTVLQKSKEENDRTQKEFTAVSEKIHQSEKQTKSRCANLTKCMETGVTEGEKILAERKSLLDSAVSDAKNYESTVLQLTEDGSKNVADVMNACEEERRRQTDWTKGIQDVCKEAEQNFQNNVELFARNFKDNKENLAAQMNTLHSGYDEAFKQVMQQDETMTSKTKESLQEHCVEVFNWSEVQRSSVYEQAGKVREFWDSTYLVDLPTGATPRRQAYDYPKTLSATSPHDRIIGRFRATRRVYDDGEDQENF